MTEPVVLINVFEVSSTEAEAFIAGWESARDYLQTQPGYIDTVLHQALASNAEFQFINVAHWRTADDFIAAIDSPGFKATTASLSGFLSHPALYQPVRS